MISKNTLKFKEELEKSGVCLVAVSKTQSADVIREFYDSGFTNFGENRVQALVEKYSQLPREIHWHFIGHLQRNKVKYIAPFVHLIHSVDSIRLLDEIDKCAKNHNRVINCLIQVKISGDASKYGCMPEDIQSILEHSIHQCNNIQIGGLMGMASFTADEEEIMTEFTKLKNIFSDLKRDLYSNDNSFTELSMGMSDDYKLAIDCGSTMVRIGSLLFR